MLATKHPLDFRVLGKIVVTGASGFVGAHLCQYFAARGAEVVPLVGRNDWRLKHLCGEELRGVALDLGDRQAVEAFVQNMDPAVILHCAAYGAYSSQADADRIYRVGFDAVRYLLDAVRDRPNFRAFVHAGSSSEYGLNCAGPDEESHPLPDSHYAVAKLAASHLVQLYGNKFGVPAWSLRLYSVYGPLEDASRLIPKLLSAARRRELPPLVNPAISRDFVHVDDVCEAFAAVVARAEQLRKGDAFNIGTGKKSTIGELVALAKELFAITAEPAWGSMSARHWDHPEWFANPQKAATLLGWMAKISLQEGLLSNAQWNVDHAEAVADAQAHSVVRPA